MRAISMPLHWDEVKPGLKTSDFTLKNVPALLTERGDVFQGIWKDELEMEKVLERLEG